MFLSKSRLMLFARALAYGGVGAIAGLVIGFVVALIAATIVWAMQAGQVSGISFRSFFPSFAVVGFMFGPIVFAIFGALVGMREECCGDEMSDEEFAMALAEAEAEAALEPEVVIQA